MCVCAADAAVQEEGLQIPRYCLLLMNVHFHKASSRVVWMYPLHQKAYKRYCLPSGTSSQFRLEEGSFRIVSTSFHSPQHFLTFCIIFCSKICSIIIFSIT